MYQTVLNCPNHLINQSKVITVAPTQMTELVCLSTCIVTCPLSESRMTIVTLKMFTVHMNIPVLDVLQPGHGVHMIYAN